MNPRLLLVSAVTVCVVCAAGCAKKPAGASAEARSRLDLASAFGGGTDRQLSGEPLTVHYLDVYQLTLPVGAVSRSDEFWKRVDEQGVDIGTYDLLQKNGFRVGIAPASEWPYFKGILDQYPAVTKKTSVTAGESGALELLMKKGIPSQYLFYLTDDNTLMGRTYDRCDNLMSLAFQAAPRKPGQVRVTLCPLVRSVRGEFQISVTNEEREYEYVRPERLYDLNLCCDVPVKGFLVVAPSTMAKWSATLGNAFLVDGGAAERFEHVLILVPRPSSMRGVGPVRPK
jgi:hypothetical protein